MIYLVEDDDSIRKLVIYALESHGYEAQGCLENTSGLEYEGKTDHCRIGSLEK